jgi:Tfp pilus assembly protein PilO
LIKPLDVDIFTLRTELKEKQDKLESAKQTLAKYDEFKKRSATVERELEWAQNRIPGLLDKSKFVESINAIQTKSQVSLTNFKFRGSSAPVKGTLPEVQVDVKFNSNYDQLLGFFREIGFSKNLMLVHELKLAPYVDPTNGDKTLAVQMVLGGLQQGKK